MTAYTLTETSTGSGDWGDIALRFSNSGGIGASASATGTATIHITTTQDNSAVAVMVLDWNAVSGSSRVWGTVNGYTPTAANGLEQEYTLVSGASGYGSYVAYYPNVGAAGTYTVGLAAPTGTAGTIVAVEIRSVATGIKVALPTASVAVKAPAPTIPAQLLPGLVQEKDGSSTTTSLTLTLNASTALSNGLIIAVAGYYGGSISSITLGGTGGLFKRVATSSGFNAEIWFCPKVTVASPTIVITTTAAGILAWAYEVRGTSLTTFTGSSVSLDKTGGNYFTSGTAWSASPPATLGGQEFVVGLGMTVNTAANTITGPSSGGWTNEASHNNVAAGSFQLSGISGYQVQSSTSSTYNYSGTTSASTSGAAVAATFLLAPTDTRWGGQVFYEHSSYTGISATFTVPALTGEAGALNSIWVGLGNVYQVGIFQTYDTTKTGNAACRCWSFWLPGAGEDWNQTAFPANAGDSLTLAIQLTSTSWLMTITNTTRGWTYTENKSVLAVNVGSGGIWPYPCKQAEVIIEKEGSAPNPDYGTLAFTAITTTPQIITGPQPLATVNTAIDQYPGPFTISPQGDGSFTMNWNGYQ